MEILNKIQKELKAPKSNRNSFGNYNYRSCEDILEAVKPLLGTAILTISDEIVNIGDRYYVKSSARLSEIIQGKVVDCTVSAYAREPLEKKGMDAAQITGATSSYARKYALNGLFCIDDTKDADTQDNTAKATTQPHTTPADARKRAELDITQETTILGLNDLMVKIQKSKNLSPEDKEDLGFLINEKRETMDPTKD